MLVDDILLYGATAAPLIALTQFASHIIVGSTACKYWDSLEIRPYQYPPPQNILSARFLEDDVKMLVVPKVASLELC